MNLAELSFEEFKFGSSKFFQTQAKLELDSFETQVKYQ